MENWIKVFEDQNQIRAEIVKGVLEEKGVPAVVLNKKESVYHVFGTYQVLVPNDQAIQALQLIQHEIEF
jgi:predicted glycosyltransferase